MIVLQTTRALSSEHYCCFWVGMGTEYSYSDSKIEEQAIKPIERASLSRVP